MKYEKKNDRNGDELGIKLVKIVLFNRPVNLMRMMASMQMRRGVED